MSEVDAYAFIKEHLAIQGWVVKNPTRVHDGQVYTQRECLDHPEIQKHLILDHPENVVKLSESLFYIIEAKSSKDKIKLAVSEAIDYAERINKSHIIKAVIVSGVAGNSTDDFIVRSFYLKDGKFQPVRLNGREATSLISPTIAKQLIDTDEPEIADVPVPEETFLKSAYEINKTLHLGAINKNQRARVMAAVLLSMIDEVAPNVDKSARGLIDEINSNAENVLLRNKKVEFKDHIKIALPASADNHIKFKGAIVRTIQELRNLNIRSAMNSGTDVLGKFYEVFLKYGNGSKEIGIVLTPRHITRFAAEIFEITTKDIVYDPTCGTGGFLVAAFDQARRTAANGSDVDYFKNNGLYGIEQEPEVAALAIVNMIFRGDGKNNIIEGNCFQKKLVLKTSESGKVSARFYNIAELPKTYSPAATKVLMNPPFALKESDEKEFRFVEHALDQMQDGQLLFTVLPRSAMVKQATYKKWREDLITKHTLLAVINFPDDVFYPIGVQTCGVIIKKGIKHPSSQNVLWLRIRTDGLLKMKGKRLPSPRTTNELEEKKDLVKRFIHDPDIRVKNIPEVQKACPLDLTDKLYEWLPEVYLDETKPSDEKLAEQVEHTLRETISFMIKDNRIDQFIANVLSKESDLFKSVKMPKDELNWKEVSVSELFQEQIETGTYHVSGELDDGTVPLVSCSAENNGFEGKFDVPTENAANNAITIASDGQPLAAFYHYYPFVAKDNVIVGIPKRNYRFTTLLFVVAQLNSLRWRFSYGRKCYLNKIHKIKIFLPYAEEDEIHEEYIQYLFQNAPSWDTLQKLMSDTVRARSL